MGSDRSACVRKSRLLKCIVARGTSTSTAYLRARPHNPVVLMHACAHNPSGVDPTGAQWAQIAAAVRERRLVPMVVAAYQSLATGDLDEDVCARLRRCRASR